MKNITTDNVFEDVGFDKQEAANMRIRLELLLEIREYIRKKGYKQKDAAVLLGINQPEVSALMRGHIFKFSIDALVNMLVKIGRELQITIRTKDEIEKDRLSEAHKRAREPDEGIVQPIPAAEVRRKALSA